MTKLFDHICIDYFFSFLKHLMTLLPNKFIIIITSKEYQNEHLIC